MIRWTQQGGVEHDLPMPPLDDSTDETADDRWYTLNDGWAR